MGVAVFIASSVSGLFRVIRYLFQIGFECDDANVFPYIIISGMIMDSVSLFVFRNRLDWHNIHNVFYVGGYAVTLAYPLMTMDINMDPCAAVNVGHRAHV